MLQQSQNCRLLQCVQHEQWFRGRYDLVHAFKAHTLCACRLAECACQWWFVVRPQPLIHGLMSKDRLHTVCGFYSFFPDSTTCHLLYELGTRFFLRNCVSRTCDNKLAFETMHISWATIVHSADSANKVFCMINCDYWMPTEGVFSLNYYYHFSTFGHCNNNNSDVRLP